METIEINEENIAKAYETLGVPLSSNPYTSDDLEKAKKDYEKAKDDYEKAKKIKKDGKKDGEDYEGDMYMKAHEGDYYRKMKKADNGGIEYVDDKKYKKAAKGGYEQIMEAASTKFAQAGSRQGGETGKLKEKVGKMKKAVEDMENSEELLAQINEFEKSLEPDEMGNLKEQVEQVGEKFKVAGELSRALEKKIEKGVKELQGELKKSNEELQDRVKKLEDKPDPRKSFTTKEYIEKGFGPNGEDLKGKKLLSLSQNYPEITNLLASKANIEKGDESDPLFVDALLKYEASKTLPMEIIKKLNEENIYIGN